jgi:hypothetical protein
MYPHRIRLRGPWECEPLQRRPADDAPLPPARRMTMPCRWADGGLADFSGRVRFVRRFGYPGRIDVHERVWLVFDGVRDRAEVRLNGDVVGDHTGDGSFEFEVTSRLRPRNELIVDVEGDAVHGGLWGEVALEVRCVAFLRHLDICATANGDVVCLEVSGELIGLEERSLELYVLLGRSTVGYFAMRAVSGTQPFHFNLEKLPLAGWLDGEGKLGTAVVQVDLVNASAVWYTMSQEISLTRASTTDR